MSNRHRLELVLSSFFLLLVLTPLGLSASPPPVGQVTVDVRLTSTLIDSAQLPGYGAGVTELELLRAPMHGELLPTLPSGSQSSWQPPFTFEPSAAFWSLGSDSFSYRLTYQDGSDEVATVILVAGRHWGDRVCFQDFEDGTIATAPPWAAEGTPLTHPDAAIAGDWGLRTTVPNGNGLPDSYLRCSPSGVGQNNGSRIRVGMTPPDPVQGLQEDVLVFSAEAASSGQELLRLWLTDLDPGFAVYGEIWDPASEAWVATASGPLGTEPVWVILDWWPNDPAAFAQGGLAFWLDEILIDRISAVQTFDPQDLVFNFGLQGVSQQPFTLDLDELEVRQGAVEHDFEAVAGGGFESGVPEPWVPGPGTVQGLSVSAAAAITGDWGLESDLVAGFGRQEYLADPTLEGHESYGVRFLLDTQSSSLAPGDMVLLLDVLDGDTLTGPAEHLKLTLRRQSSSTSFTLRGRVREGGTQTAGPWDASSAATLADGIHAIEMTWRAASRPGAANGYLRLWIDGTYAAGVEGLSNYGRTVESAILGTLGIDAGSSGFLYLDDFEAWVPRH